MTAPARTQHRLGRARTASGVIYAQGKENRRVAALDEQLEQAERQCQELLDAREKTVGAVLVGQVAEQEPAKAQVVNLIWKSCVLVEVSVIFAGSPIMSSLQCLR